jgi:3-methyladenine DNA glycosylase AlkC
MNDSTEKWEVRFEKALVYNDVSEAIKILEERNKFSGTPRGVDKVKALEAVLRLGMTPDESHHWANRLLDNDSAAARDLAAMLTVTFIAPLYTLQPVAAEEIILRIADDTHWEVREDADNVMLQIVKVDFTKAYNQLKKWATHPSENVRRAVVMTAKKAGRERRPEWACPLLDLLELLLNDRSAYVRKNLGPFAIGDGFLRYYPALTLQYLDQWSKMSDEQVRWNVAMVFSSAEAAKYIDAALPILERLASDERRFVWRAVASAMRNLGRRVPDRIIPVLERWLEDELRVRPAQIAFKYI